MSEEQQFLARIEQSPWDDALRQVFADWLDERGRAAEAMHQRKFIAKCPKCGSLPKDHEVRNHSLMWGDGDVYCTKCDAYVRMYDAG